MPVFQGFAYLEPDEARTPATNKNRSMMSVKRIKSYRLLVFAQAAVTVHRIGNRVDVIFTVIVERAAEQLIRNHVVHCGELGNRAF